jgi:hypothetical protein
MAIISDDPMLTAQLSCLLARPETYLPVLDGPRLSRPDADAETIRRLNATARVRAQKIVLAGLSEESIEALSSHAGERRRARLKIIRAWKDAGSLEQPPLSEVISWGRTRIGIGLLKALRRGSAIKFNDGPSPTDNVVSLSGHLVICEEGDDLAQVVAANYAYALGAGLFLIPNVARSTAEDVLERFYSVQEDRTRSASEALEEFKADIRNRCDRLPLTDNSSLTFIGSGLPYGFAFPECPSTHLFDYPDLGIAIANGFATQQSRARGLDVAVLVDPKTTEAPEIRAAERLLPARGIFLRCYEGGGATVRNVTEMVEMYPYDLLVFATHCGDVSGWRWTYEYVDNEGLNRTLVVDIAIGVADTDDDDMLNVTQFMRFVSLDGVDWNDPKKKEQLYIGTAITTFMERSRTGIKDELQPVKKEVIPRVIGSAALKMRDHNYLALPRSIADDGNPIILNNACCSWHKLAQTFAFSGARAYLGTLFPVLTSEAEAVTNAILGMRFGECLPEAVWASQRDAFGASVRRPYLMMGIYPQAMKVIQRDVPQYLANRLGRSGTDWLTHASQTKATDEKTRKWIAQKTNYYRRELLSLKENWLGAQ